ncbi:UPF0280 family protein [Microvirga massiliensis]|uniref:UPF0280 family protein n=1 Tax=Microvirga massiliensis TaxID=1033741 RepID=UPI00062BF155|nr:UPF0280 family protein [Microvirga massiliensis]
MTRTPQVRLLSDGRRLHLQDGPIDLIIEVFGKSDAIRVAYAAATQRFTGLLDELCGELTSLRARARPEDPSLDGPVARRMQKAVMPFADRTFITPMASVAGAVAEEILAAMLEAAELDKAYVNDGGDIALHLSGNESFTIGLIDRPDCPGLFGRATLSAGDGVRGIATSGWRGRSFSRGIADAVTILASGAAAADAAATIVANAVDLPDHPAVSRCPACELQPDSDLRRLAVTRDVGPLSLADIDAALREGVAAAEHLIREGLIHAAALHLQGGTRIVGFASLVSASDRVAAQLVHA